MDERRLERVSGRAQEMADGADAYEHGRARDVSEQVERLTGRSMESVLGFLLGKILARD
jgi:hypothetical protein